MYIDIKLFAKNVKELETLMQSVRVYIQNMGIEFVIEKCTMPKMRREKRLMPSQEKIRRLREKETYKYFGILERNTIKQR